MVVQWSVDSSLLQEIPGSILAQSKLFSRSPEFLKFVCCQRTRKKNVEKMLKKHNLREKMFFLNAIVNPFPTKVEQKKYLGI